MAEFKELNKSAIGARIRKRRELLGLSREELAEQLGVTAKFIGDIEYGEKGAEDGISEEKEIKILQENIMGSLSVCSARQLGVMEQIARLYVEGVVLDEPQE